MAKIKLMGILAATISMILTLFCVPAAAMPPASITGRQMVTNSGFERDLTGWINSGSTPAWQAGGAEGSTGCAYVKVNNNFNDISQNLIFQKDKKYHISVYLKAEANADGSTRNTVAEILVSFEKITRYLCSDTPISSDKWTKIETVMVAGTDSEGRDVGRGKLYVRIGPKPQNNNKINYYIDEFCCFEYDANDVVNGNMENGIAGWNASGATIAQVAGGASGTNKSAKVTITNNNFASVYQNYKFMPDTLYLIRMWIKLEQGQSVAQVLISHTDTKDTGTEYLAVNTPVDTSWKEFKIYYKYSSSRGGTTGAGNFYFRVGDNPGSSKINYYMDEVSITEVTEPMCNGDFDFDTSMWKSENAAVSLVKDTPTGTAGAAKVIMYEEGGTISQQVRLAANENYTLSFWMKSDVEGTAILPTLTVGEQVLQLGQPQQVSTQWSFYQFRFLSIEGFENPTLRFEVAGAPVIFYVDEIELYKSIPKVRNLTTEGAAVVGGVISVTYDYDNFGLDAPEGDTQYQWLVGNYFGTEWAEYSSGVAKAGSPIQIVLDAKLLNQQVKLAIVPQDINGVQGEKVETVSKLVKMPYVKTGGFTGSLTPGGMLGATLQIVNNYDDDRYIAVFLTLYDAEGRMLDIACQRSLVDAEGGSCTFSPQITLPDNVEGCTARILIWDGRARGITNMAAMFQYDELTNAE